MRVLIAPAITLLTAAALLAGPSAAPSFEIASVKPSAPGTLGGKVQYLPGGRFRATNVPLNFLIQDTYQIRKFQLIAAAPWSSVVADGYSSRYNIEATAAVPSADKAQLRAMVSDLLAQRFQLKAHQETRPLPVYVLAPARSGIALRPSQDAHANGRVAFMAPGWIQGHGVPMATLVNALSELVDRPVVDRTGFTAPFDFRLTFTPEQDLGRQTGAALDSGCAVILASQKDRGSKEPPPTCPSIFTAVQQQLGLKLDPQKEPVQVLVIDHVERPSAN